MNEPRLPVVTSSPIPVEKDSPKSAIIYPILDCNARCPFCSTRVYTEAGVVSPHDYRWGQFRKIKEYTSSTEEVLRLYESLRQEGVESICLQGGEPTLFDGLLPVLRRGRELGFKEQVIVTNGRQLRDRAFTEELLGAGVTTLSFSIFGARPETHDEAMGVPHAWDDLIEAVKHLFALRLRGRGRQVHLVANFTLYAKNYRELPEMMSFWHKQGFRSFSLRLLRETDNTQRGDPADFFFDVGLLKPYLQQALDFAVRRPDVYLSFSEIFYCLLDRHYLSFIIRDRSSNPGLHSSKRVISRHTDSVASDLSEREAELARAGITACNTCDVADTCVKVEGHYLKLLGVPLAAIDARGWFRDLLALEPSDESFDHLRALLRMDGQLEGLGVGAGERQLLRAKLVGWAHARKHADLGSLLFHREQLKPLKDQLLFGRSRKRPLEFRYVDLAPLAGTEPPGPLPPDAATLLERVRAAGLGAGPGAVDGRPLAASVSFAHGPLVSVFGSWVREEPGPPRPDVPVDAGDQLVVTTLHDRRLVPQDLVAAALDRLSRN